MQHHPALSYINYSTGHPWFYYLGGPILKPKAQRRSKSPRASGYKGYLRDEIAKADQKTEPARSNALRAIRARAVAELRSDLSGYRKCALELRRYRKGNRTPSDPRGCDSIHTAISLKHNHLVNDFAHLIWLDDLLNQQGDLFGF